MKIDKPPTDVINIATQPCCCKCPRLAGKDTKHKQFGSIACDMPFWFQGALHMGWLFTDGKWHTRTQHTGSNVENKVLDLVIPEPRAKVVFDG